MCSVILRCKVLNELKILLIQIALIENNLDVQ